MNRSCIILSLCLISPTHALAGPMEDAQAAWAQREQPGQVEKAIALWEQAAATSPEAHIWLAKATGRLYRRSDSKQEKRKWAEMSRDHAQKAVEKNPQSAGAYTMLGMALGQ